MSDMLFCIQGRAGRITLNRSAALNALNVTMVRSLETALDHWREDPGVDLILIEGAGPRAFCAGGDIATIYHDGCRGEFTEARRFWREEYRLNAKLANYPKPIISFMHGFVLGGGVGIGGHVSHRIVGESSRVAMPETGIGLIPDVGGTFRLSKAPGRLGHWLALTGGRMGPGDAIHAGFADAFVPEADWEALKTQLCETGLPEIPNHPTPEAPLAQDAEAINKLMAGDTLEAIRATVSAAKGPRAEETQKALARNSPLAMQLSLGLLDRFRNTDQTIEASLEAEYRVVHRILEDGDFLEGVRAAIIDKDKSPKWHYGPEGAPQTKVDGFFASLGEQDLSFQEHGMKIGFIGLGNMGAPMARNLASAGHAVLGFDLSAPMPAGVAPVRSAAEVAKDADVVITMLPNGEILRAVANEVLPSMKPKAVLLDCSTVDVDSARAVAEQAASAGLLSLDAPVSGGVGGADAGTLTFMVGGSDEAFALCAPLFDIMGQKAVHCGASGNGQAAKICNNMILGVTMIATCEAFSLADKLGLSRQAMFDVVSTSSGYSWSMNAYCPAPGVGPESPADRDYQPGFAAELMLKDLGLSQQAAKAADADTPMGESALELYRRFVEDEDGKGQDFSAMLPRFETRGRG